MDMYKRDIIKQAKKFGIENRIDQTQEECAELIQALSKYKRTVVKKDKTCSVDELKARNMVTEEIADVEFCLTQIKKLLSISDMEIEGIKSVKVTRTKKRMENK
jgi:NTP pyrophosphatase (non-canonical NTP hydrolase)